MPPPRSRGRVERLRADPDPPQGARAAGHGRDQRQLVAGGEPVCDRGILAVDGGHERSLRALGRVPSARRAASASATVAPSGSESGNDVAPACSRSDAKSRTVISMTEKANPQLTHLDASGAAGSWRR